MGELEHHHLHSAPLREVATIFPQQKNFSMMKEMGGKLKYFSTSAPLCQDKEWIAKAQQADEYRVKKLLYNYQYCKISGFSFNSFYIKLPFSFFVHAYFAKKPNHSYKEMLDCLTRLYR